jgi:hypothetical protein
MPLLHDAVASIHGRDSGGGLGAQIGVPRARACPNSGGDVPFWRLCLCPAKSRFPTAETAVIACATPEFVNHKLIDVVPQSGYLTCGEKGGLEQPQCDEQRDDAA